MLSSAEQSWIVTNIADNKELELVWDSKAAI